MNSILTKLNSIVGPVAATILATALSWFETSLASLAEDELAIFGNALSVLLTDIKAGKGWEVAYTDALNTFYKMEEDEAAKLETAILEAIAKIADAIKSAL